MNRLILGKFNPASVSLNMNFHVCDGGEELSLADLKKIGMMDHQMLKGGTCF